MPSKILVLIGSHSVGDTLCAIPTIKHLSQVYQTNIHVFTYQPDLLKNIPYITLSDNYDVKQDELLIETFRTDLFVHTRTDIRQIHALSAGFQLLPEEMEIDFFADELGLKEQVSKITEAAMNGELDFFESLQQRVGLLKGLEYSIVAKISRNLPYMNGAAETIAELKKRGMKVVCFSGGFRSATGYAKNILGYDADFSNVLHHKNQILTGLVGGDMMFNYSKGDMLIRLQGLLGVMEEETLVCGDGANDLSMFAHAGTRVAFCAKEILKKEANIVIETKDLTQILEKI